MADDERELPFDPATAEAAPEAITIVCRTSRRVFVPHLREYRDVGFASAPIAALRIDASDPAFEFMKEWAEREPDASIDGHVPAGVFCPICRERAADQDELAQHAKDVHWDDGNENPDAVDPTRPPKKPRATKG